MRVPVWICVLLLACARTPTPKDDTDVAGDTDADTDVAVGPWRSTLYPDDWTPALTDAEGRFLHDFSYAGYRAGQALPQTLPEPVVSVLTYDADPTGATDSTAAIQAAVDAVYEGGTVSLPAGTYRIDGEVRVTHSGIVVAGAGTDKTFVHFTRAVDQSGAAGLQFRGTISDEGLDWPLAQDAASRANVVQVEDSLGLLVGDSVDVGWNITDAFIAAHEMTGTWVSFNGQWKPFFRRTVVAIDGDQITLDVPLRSDALVRDGASIRLDPGYLTDVGLQDLSVSSVVDNNAAQAAAQHHAIKLYHVMDSWITRVASYDPQGQDGPTLQSGGILVQDSRRVTVADVVLRGAQNLGGGGNGYLVEIMRSGEVLVRDTTATQGRHNFIQNWDFGTTGCVFLRTHSAEGQARNGALSVVGLSEFRHSLAMANLIDASTADDGWQSVNRHSESSGAGVSGTEIVFWNLSGAGTVRSMQHDLGYVIGTGPELTVLTDPSAPDPLLGGTDTSPEDWTEGLGAAASLVPQSLYEDQLRRRLGL